MWALVVTLHKRSITLLILPFLTRTILVLEISITNYVDFLSSVKNIWSLTFFKFDVIKEHLQILTHWQQEITIQSASGY